MMADSGERHLEIGLADGQCPTQIILYSLWLTWLKPSGVFFPFRDYIYISLGKYGHKEVWVYTGQPVHTPFSSRHLSEPH